MLLELQQNSQRFVNERPSLARTQNDPKTVLRMALEEVHELIEAEGDEVLGELTDVFNYLAQFAVLVGVSEEQILAYSRWVYEIRNFEKYPPEEDGVVSRQNQRAFWEHRAKVGVGNDYY